MRLLKLQWIGCGLCSAALVLAMGWPTRAIASERQADHTIYVRLSSEPSGAKVYAFPTDSEVPVELGVTPYTLVGELTWERIWRGRQWDKLKVWSPGEAFFTAYSVSNKTHKIGMRIALAMGGYKPSPLVQEVLTLERSAYDADALRTNPTEKKVQVVLEPLHEAVPTPTAAPLPPRKLVISTGAREGDPEMGTLLLRGGRADDVVFLDDQPVGPPPLQLLLWTGQHQLRVENANSEIVLDEIINVHSTGAERVIP